MSKDKLSAFTLYISKRGVRTQLARQLGITPQAVFDWGDQVPAGRALEVERLTCIRRELLRPDIYPPEDARTRPLGRKKEKRPRLAA